MKEESFIYAASTLVSRILNLGKNKKRNDIHKILVIKLDEIGDVVNALHVFPLLINRFPNAQTTLWCKPFVKPLLENDPSIHKIVLKRAELENRYDLIIDLRGNWSSIFYALFHPPKIRLDRGTVRLKNKIEGGHPHEVLTNLQIIEPILLDVPKEFNLQIYTSQSENLKAKQWLEENKIENFVIFHTGARRILRRWKSQNFAAIAEYLHREKKFDIVFTGDQNDADSIQEIRDMINFKTYSIAGDFSLSEYAALVSQSKLFIGNESGPLHIAAASQVPVIGLFGPGEPFVFYPWGKSSSYIHHVLDCNPCDQIHCVRPDNTCMDLISTAEVKLQIEKLLS